MCSGNLRTRVVLVCSILFAAATMQAQVSTGSVAGRVTDPAHAVIPSAIVNLINQGTGIQKSMKTDANGDYMFPIVEAGSYRLHVEAPGFRVYEASGLTVQVAQPVTQDVALQVGDTSTKV